ncbi:MAG: LLM class flavin-dependent oxidoreductase [Pseudomonadota bacterium]|nr:LLM class flavin-dependent oxidoreductase [Pseudomonadota bacterium]
MKPQIKLGMFYWPCGHHIAAWRHPDGVPDSGNNIAHLIELAKLSEEGLFDMFFMADSLSFWRADIDAMSRDSQCAWIEPFSLMVVLGQHTKNLGLVCTSTTTYDQPYLIARRFASLDIASGGRGGWNLITSGNPKEAASFGADEHLEKGARYRRAREFAHVVRALWNSWGENVWVHDKGSGQFFNKEELQVLEHQGEFLRCRGPLNVPRSPQGEPVLVQAGASEDGRQLAAETAEVVFGAQQTLEGAQEFYNDVKGRMLDIGRNPDSLKIMPGLTTMVAETHDEAVDRFEELQELIDPAAGLQLLSQRMGHDMSGHDINDLMPLLPPDPRGGSRRDLVVAQARRERLTIKDMYRNFAASRGHGLVIGDTKEVADMMEEWVVEKGCDGFNVMPPIFPSDLHSFNRLVVPELQRRGLYRTKYEGSTLRANLGLAHPPWASDNYQTPDTAQQNT